MATPSIWSFWVQHGIKSVPESFVVGFLRLIRSKVDTRSIFDIVAPTVFTTFYIGALKNADDIKRDVCVSSTPI